MNLDDVRKRAFAMPLTSPAFPPGPYRFIDREYLVITYRTDPAALDAVVPAPLTFDEPLVNYEFIRMPDSTGFGNYTESGQVIPVNFEGRQGNYTHAMFLNDGPPIYGGRELWGFPKKYAQPTLSADKDTLVGTLDYGSVRVATGTMGFKHKALDVAKVAASFGEAELSPEDHPACRRQPPHSGARRLPARGRRREGRLVRPGGARLEASRPGADQCASRARDRLGDAHHRRSHPRPGKGRVRLSQDSRSPT